MVDTHLISLLRQDGRITLTDLSKRTGIPVSTLFDRLRAARASGLIRRFTLLPSYEQLGYMSRAYVILKAKKENREELRSYLSLHPAINTLFRINNGFDFLFEAICKNMQEMENFLEELERRFHSKHTAYYLLESIAEEQFLASGILDSKLEV